MAMTITVTEFLVAVGTSIAVGWLWTGEAAVLEPVRRTVHPWLQRGGPVRRWLAKGSECSICVGFWPGLGIVALGEGLTLWAVPLALSALAVHLLWMRVTLALEELILG